MVFTNYIKKRYKLLNLLGEGQESCVFRAIDTSVLNNPYVAIKIPKQDKHSLIDELSIVQSLYDENTKNFAHIYRFEEGDEFPFIVMEYIPDATLESLLSRSEKPFSEMSGIAIVRKIGDVLRRSHSKGIAHRDIHIGNILITEDAKSPTVIDFGSALYSRIRIIEDIYCLSYLLYEILTKSIPSVDIPPKEINPNISNQTSKAITLGMKNSIDLRPQTIDDWLELLEH